MTLLERAYSRPSWSLRGRIALMALICVLPAVALAVYSYEVERAHARGDAQERNLQLARSIVNRQATALNSTHQVIEMLAGMPSVRSGLHRACGEILPDTLRDRRAILNLALITPDRTILCSHQAVGQRPLALDTELQRLVAAVAATRSPAVGPIDANRLAIVHPVRDDAGVVQKVVVAVRRLNGLGRVFRQLPANATLTVFDADRRILDREPDGDGWSEKTVQPVEMGGEGMARDGVSRLYVAAPAEADVPGGLFVGIGIPRAVVFAEADATLRQQLWLIGLVSLLAVWIAVVVGEVFLIRPIRQLTDVMHRLARGDLGARAELAAGAPGLRELTASLNETASALEGQDRERAALQHQLVQSQKLEAIGRLAGGVAHDFNNLLTAILGYCDLLRHRTDLSDEVRDELLEIERAGQSAASLTSQLLAFSRRQALQPRVLNLNDVVNRVESLLQRIIGEDILLVKRLDPGLGAVCADPAQIEQVVMNLAVNARDAMPGGGTLVIETRSAILDESDAARHPGSNAGPHVVLTLSDTGCGMTAETRARLFEPFFTTKEPGKGTGLGLATVYGIVRQSEGSIRVSSEPGHGSCFKIYLPATAAPAEHTSHAEAGEAPDGHETILVVEDQTPVRALVRKALTRRGYAVLEAANGSEALHMVDRHPGSIDLVLSDLVMPGMNGPALVKRLGVLRRGIRVLFMSGYTDQAALQTAALEAGSNFVQKPFTPPVLLRAVRAALDTSKTSPADAA